ncbi:MAG TPA: histidine--tRNA ligase [Anaerolineae bacterium]|nr:histidine--tRNA ligase [Anaerolineae bacterium]
MKPTIRPVKGTRDFYPEEMAFRTWLYGQMKAVSQKFGYQEWEAPLLETLELYAAKSGEELVKEQSFVFADRGGDTIALRPELTPSLARLVAQRQRELIKPIRWWSFGPFWRYERPQKGRTREFFQWNIDLIGVNSAYADAELVAIGAEFFKAVGLSTQQIVIKVNNRKLMEQQIARLGVTPDRIEGVYRLIDKLDKLPAEKWRAYGSDDIGLSVEQIDRLSALLNNRDLWKESADLTAFFNAIDDLGVSDYVEYDPAIIRGLAYYTGLVFEARDRTGEFRAILGGGRYDNLVADVGGDPLGGNGFAMGDVVIGLVLEKFGLKPQLRPTPADVLVTIFDAALARTAAKVAAQLRSGGVKTELYPDGVKLDKQLKYANTQAIPLAVIIGPDEAAQGQATVRDLRSGQQQSVKQEELVAQVVNLLGAK